jgi:type I restriction enzyme M protein
MKSDSYANIEELKPDLWEVSANLRANSKLSSIDYFMPVLGMIFLRHAGSRFEAASRQIAADQVSGKMPKRKADRERSSRRAKTRSPHSSKYYGQCTMASELGDSGRGEGFHSR